MVEPFLDRISRAVSDRGRERDLLERSRNRASERGGFLGRRSLVGDGRGESGSGSRHLSQLLEEFEGERTTCSFVSVDRRGHEDEVGTEEGSDEGERDRGGFIDDDQLRLTEYVEVLRLDVLLYRVSGDQCQRRRNTDLNRLTVLSEDVDTDDGVLPLGVRRLDNVVIKMLLPSELVESLEDEFEERFKILGAGTGDEDVGVRVEYGEGDGKSKRG